MVIYFTFLCSKNNVTKLALNVLNANFRETIFRKSKKKPTKKAEPEQCPDSAFCVRVLNLP
jgi:hypothetical protein